MFFSHSVFSEEPFASIQIDRKLSYQSLYSSSHFSAVQPATSKSSRNGNSNKNRIEVDEGEESEEFLDCEVPEESLLTDAHRGNKFYAEVTFKGMKIKLGDFVKVSLEDSCAGQSSTSICQVLALYDDVEGGSGIFMEARWFQTVAELSEKSRRMYVQVMMCHIIYHLRHFSR